MAARPGAALVLLCGLPGSGRTVLARRLAGRIPAVRLCPGEWMAALGIGLFDEQARDRLGGRFREHAQDLLGPGQTVILESGFWARSGRDEKRADEKRAGARALGVRVELHCLAASVDELCRCLGARSREGGAGAVPVGREPLMECV